MALFFERRWWFVYHSASFTNFGIRTSFRPKSISEKYLILKSTGNLFWCRFRTQSFATRVTAKLKKSRWTSPKLTTLRIFSSTDSKNSWWNYFPPSNASESCSDSKTSFGNFKRGRERPGGANHQVRSKSSSQEKSYSSLYQNFSRGWWFTV